MYWPGGQVNKTCLPSWNGVSSEPDTHRRPERWWRLNFPYTHSVFIPAVVSHLTPFSFFGHWSIIIFAHLPSSNRLLSWWPTPFLTNVYTASFPSFCTSADDRHLLFLLHQHRLPPPSLPFVQSSITVTSPSLCTKRGHFLYRFKGVHVQLWSLNLAPCEALAYLRPTSMLISRYPLCPFFLEPSSSFSSWIVQNLDKPPPPADPIGRRHIVQSGRSLSPANILW